MLPLSAPQRVYAAFAIYSFSMGSIFPRLGDVQQAMGVEEGALGLGLIGVPAGTMISLTFATPLLERIGFRRGLIAAIPLVAILYSIAVWAGTPLQLFLMLLPVGIAIGCVEIILNVEADRTEALIGRRIMNRAHAFWSIGFFAAGLFGAAVAGLGVSPQAHLAIVAPLSILGIWLCLSNFQPAPHRSGSSAEKPPALALPSFGILVLVVATMSCMLLEGASMDWSAIYLRDVFQAGPFVAGLGVTTFALFHALTRFYADAFVERHSPALVARVQLLVLGAGCMSVYLAHAPWLALAGFAMMGIGSSSVFPLAMSAAAQRTDRSAAINVASLAQFSFMTFLLAPPLLGLVAEHWGIRASFGIALPLVILSLITAGSLGTRARPV